MVKIGVVFTQEDSRDGKFTRFASRIGEYVDDPDTHFIFSDEQTLVARYLEQIGYRKCTVYHLGEKAKHNIGRYAKKGGFISYAEIEASIREDAAMVIDISSV